jgi:hypothetical protein
MSLEKPAIFTNEQIKGAVAEISEIVRSMDRLPSEDKRTYVIKLFADHADTQSLFSSLAKDLDRLAG